MEVEHMFKQVLDLVEKLRGPINRGLFYQTRSPWLPGDFPLGHEGICRWWPRSLCSRRGLGGLGGLGSLGDLGGRHEGICKWWPRSLCSGRGLGGLGGR
ncbi:unnamed protein product [Prunus armeniaca]